MVTQIEKDRETILKYLYVKDKESSGVAYVGSKEISDITGLTASRINDAVRLLRLDGLIEWITALGTFPYIFYSLKIGPRGKLEVQRKESIQKAGEKVIAVKETPPSQLIEKYLDIFRKYPRLPVVSPYGFTYYEWETVSKRKANRKVLYVVLGCKFKSDHYDTKELEENVKNMFKAAVDRYNKENHGENISLEFLPLHGGYGAHLFNKIAQDIISSDIAVFETSDLAPNVFIEIGVALTYGSRVFPIKREECPQPPSDISGHTYADYRDSARTFASPSHEEDLHKMVEQAIRTKG